MLITGEGKIEGQTIFGKTPIGVAKTAKKLGFPVIGIAGNISKDSYIIHQYGIDPIFSIVPGFLVLEDAFKVVRTAENIAVVLN
ncbi:glycerate kinase [Neobacillus ginsengisoli]|uniref:Glycerate kinase n=1 Tax=Neobacillus ginsengisoli TaxID=904295 RepID=A0ABT9XX94_9BACI|nr:glycerate kinase [Neobacillus ginsengisoli]